VYVTIGFEYNLKVWQKTWPPFMKSVIDACLEHKSKLVFFDNVYMYASSEIPHMTEESTVSPPSRKGAVRKEVNDLIFAAMKQKGLTALIARAADFYGPDNPNSAITQMVANNNPSAIRLKSTRIPSPRMPPGRPPSLVIRQMLSTRSGTFPPPGKK
jgi:nucleoside-diphosphate-sugar epimerase